MGKLVDCKTCKKPVDRKAQTCPHCGAPDPAVPLLRRKISPASGCIILILIVCVWAVIAANKADPTARSAPNEHRRVPAVRPDVPDPEPEPEVLSDFMFTEFAQTFIKRILKAPSSAKFPSTLWSSDAYIVRHHANDVVSVESYVDAQNSFGAMLRSSYTVAMAPVDSDNARPLYIVLGGEVLFNEWAAHNKEAALLANIKANAAEAAAHRAALEAAAAKARAEKKVALGKADALLATGLLVKSDWKMSTVWLNLAKWDNLTPEKREDAVHVFGMLKADKTGQSASLKLKASPDGPLLAICYRDGKPQLMRKQDRE